jgi:hypothetical protein
MHKCKLATKIVYLMLNDKFLKQLDNLINEKFTIQYIISAH